MAGSATQLSISEPNEGDKSQQTVECLGMVFETDEARRAYFLEKLREKLKDSEFRNIEGFPDGKDEDILALSDPPYYTACPNPFLEDFIRCNGKPYDPETDHYRREPFATDVSEGKNDPIYNVHSYHTKVPHKAIMRYILHYTEPGDVVFDGFCGTGMTGVAAQFCGDRAAIESLGCEIQKDGTILDETGKPFSKLGTRQAILNDLSPAATFISYNYNTQVDVEKFESKATSILKKVEKECSWMYLTLHQPTPDQIEQTAELLKYEASHLPTGTPYLPWGYINYTVWSDVFTCPECAREIVFWDTAVSKSAGKVLDEFFCLHCNAQLSKRILDRAWVTKFDLETNEAIKQVKQIPVLINYTFGKKRFEKSPDTFDLNLLNYIESYNCRSWFPKDRMPEGEESRRNDDIGITHTHHFYTKRNLITLASFLSQPVEEDLRQRKLFTLTGSLPDLIKSARLRIGAYFHGGRGVVSAGVSGTLYMPSISVEKRVLFGLENRIKTLSSSLKFEAKSISKFISTQSCSSFCTSTSVDYIFTDPPFGGNLMYSELNFLWEAWLKVFTKNKSEAIENKIQRKGLLEYQQLMTKCFTSYFEILKPGRWMTVEFHNSKNSVWNAIQESLQQAGFVIADVRTLDKKQGSFKQVSSGGAVKQDLVISAYKPNGGLEDRFKLEAGTEEGVWDFVQTHLKQIPVFVAKDGQGEMLAERQNYLLYDRMVAFYFKRKGTIPLSAAEFYAGLDQRFGPPRDGMYFLPEQAAEYDRKRHTVREFLQLELLVTDEESAIQWVRQQLTRKPQTLQDLTPKFMKEGQRSWAKHERLFELRELLEDNFPCYRGDGPIPPQIVSWLKESSTYREIINAIEADHITEAGLETQNPILLDAAGDRWYVPNPDRARDLELIRDQKLLREFEQYRQSKQRKLKQFRTEAIRAGFKKCWQERSESGYRTIVDIAHKIPETILQEDSKLFRYYNQAITRLGDI